MNKFPLAIFITITVTTAALADVEIYRGGRGYANNLIRVSYRHVPLSDPSEPYHETYRKNRGEIYAQAPKPVANLHAKQSAAQADALRYAAKAEQAKRSSISVYSNVTVHPPASRQTTTSGDNGHNITINNSSVVINLPDLRSVDIKQ